jgi:membrane fusion protein (multidrug efflux system)
MSDAFGERGFEGRVGAIDSRVSQTARAFKVRATIPNPDLALRTGMFMSLELILDERRSLSVPEVAVLTEGDKSFVFATKDGRAERVEVEIGLRHAGAVEVIEGLTQDQPVVTGGMQAVEDGAPIRLQDDPPAAALPGVSS